MSERKSSVDVRTITFLGILTALVVVLQLIGNFIAVPIGPYQVSISLSLVPIVLASTTKGKFGGPIAGGCLGFVSAMVILFGGGATFFLGLNALGTILVVIVKGVSCGVVAGFAYKFISSGSKYVAVIFSAVLCPVVNTGIFFIGGFIFFNDVMPLIAIGALVNFTFELIVNIVLSPTILKLIEMREDKKA